MTMSDKAESKMFPCERFEVFFTLPLFVIEHNNY